MQPLVSIIIPSYNRSHCIGETLESVMDQDYLEWECLVIDDGSLDWTQELMGFYCEREPRIRYYKRSDCHLKGPSGCRNYGAEISEGNYLIFLDSDDLMLGNCLEKRIHRINQYQKNHFWVFPMFVESNGRNIPKKIPVNTEYLNDFLSLQLHWGVMCTVWDSTFFKDLKGFKENYPRLEDPEIHIRGMIAAKSGYKVFHDSSPDTIYRPNPTINPILFAKEYYRSLTLFIPEISVLLKENGLDVKLGALKNYFTDFEIVASSFMGKKEKIKLLRICRENRVISQREYFIYFFLFVFGKNQERKPYNLTIH